MSCHGGRIWPRIIDTSERTAVRSNQSALYQLQTEQTTSALNLTLFVEVDEEYSASAVALSGGKICAVMVD